MGTAGVASGETNVGMRYINGLIGVALLFVAGSHVGKTDAIIWLPIYGAGAVIALSSLKTRMPDWMVWACAVAAAGMMFAYFSLFFQIAPHLRGDWIMQGHACSNLLIAAFCMIPVLSEYSRRMKVRQESRDSRVGREESVSDFSLRRLLSRFLPDRSPEQIRKPTA